jgi:hypothetical protein
MLGVYSSGVQYNLEFSVVGRYSAVAKWNVYSICTVVKAFDGAAQ